MDRAIPIGEPDSYTSKDKMDGVRFDASMSYADPMFRFMTNLYYNSRFFGEVNNNTTW